EHRRHLDPGRDHGISGRGLSTSRDVGPARFSQPDLFPRGRQRRPLRGVGVPGSVRGGAAGGVQILTVAQKGALMTPLLQIVVLAAMFGAPLREEFTMTQMEQATTDTATAIRPFRVHIPEADVAGMRRRLLATRWPDKETVADQSTGVSLARLQQLVQYWGTGYDWRKVEAKLNALPQFMTNIDGVDIHFIHVKSRHPNAL